MRNFITSAIKNLSGLTLSKTLRISGRSLVLVLAFFCLCSFCGNNERSRAPFTFMDVSVKEAIYQGKRHNRPVFIFICADYCNTSQKMINQVFRDKEIKSLMNNNFICKKFDPSSPINNMIATNWGFTQAPGYLFMDEKGKIILKDGGFKNKEEFMSLVTAALEKLDAGKVAVNTGK